MSNLTKFLRQNALTASLLLACCAICIGLVHENVRRVPVPIASSPVVNVEGDGIPLTAGEDVLDRVIPELKLEERPTVETVIQVIARTAPCNISVNWRNLEAAGAGREALVPPSYGPYHNITVRKALSHLWQGKDVAVGYMVQDNVILIDTQDNLAKNTVTLIYNVRDLIGEMINSKTYATDQECGDALSRLLTDCINSDSWRDNGGNVGSVREMMGLLIITQTPDNHRSVAVLLDLLRRAVRIRGILAIPPIVATALPAPPTQPVRIEPPTPTEDDQLQVYDVRDLIDLMGRQPNLRHNPDFPNRSPRDLAINELTETISGTVDPDSWQENGGGPGLMRETMGRLIIRQSSKNQKAVEQVLEAMRKELRGVTPAKTAVR